MSPKIVEQSVAGLRWLVVEGNRDEAFAALGAATARDIRAVIGAMPEASALHEYAASDEGSQAITDLLAAAEAYNSRELRELGQLAEGAGVTKQSLLLANLRGDLGGNDGVGCSELAYAGTHSLLAHNEDGAPALADRLMLLTLRITGEAPVTIQWYPGFLPCNTFVVTANGLAWGINHVQVPMPAAAPGRHFVARALQQASDLDSAARYLATQPTAGGFAYTIGELGTGRMATVEAAAGRHAERRADPVERPRLWHTNHLRFLPMHGGRHEPGDHRGVRSLGAREESEVRGRVLASLQAPQGGVTVEWLLEKLSRESTPNGVYRSAVADDPLLTLCTTVVDLTASAITLSPRGGKPVTLDASAFARGSLQPV